MSNPELQNWADKDKLLDARQKLRILLVEDDKVDYLNTARLLDQAYGSNYTLTWETSPDSAIERIKSAEYDVFLVDYSLGATSGIELINKLESEHKSGLAIIMLTAMDRLKVDLMATEAGATDYLVKSQLKPEILERSIRYSRHQKEAEAKVRLLFYYDALTGLANRPLFEKYLEQAISAAKGNSEYAALVFLDLDNFKSINDSLGHHVGDRLLIEVSSRLENCIRSEDVVARLGGDEFVLIFSRLSRDQKEAHEQVIRLSDKIRAVVSAPIKIAEHNLRVSCSIGVTLFCDQCSTSETLVKQADIAMYRAKGDGKNLVRFFEASMEISVKKDYWAEQELHGAFEFSQFELFLQPIVDLASSKIVGAEALIRWRHPDKGLLMPEDFIPIAEKTDFICSIGRYVMNQACQYLDKMPMLEYISINIHARHFESDEFSTELRSALSQSKTNPRRMVVELTESAFLDNSEQSRNKIAALREIGIGFALDDFGTGYSSLSVLKDLSFNILKIDRSFVNDIGDQANNDVITEAIIGMSKTLGLKVIAEGVETPEQLKFLIEHGCTSGQGYHFSRPMPYKDFAALLKA